MKIIYYSPHPGLNLMSTSGYGTHMREMINAFRESGHDVFPLIMGGESASDNGIKESERSLKKAFKKIIPSKVWRTLKDMQLLRFDYQGQAQLEKMIDKYKPDLIYERCNYLQTSGVEVANSKGIKHIMEINSPYVEETYFLEGASSYLRNRAYKLEKKQAESTDQIVVVSSALRDYYIKTHNISSSKIEVVPNAINPADIKVDQEQKEKIISKYQLDGNLVIGYVGSIFKWQGVDLLIDAFLELNLPDARLLIVGGGELLESLKQKVKSTTQNGHIIFTNWVPHEEIYNYIDIMDICVMANSNWYQSPVKIFEYGALGKPVIAPNSIPVKDVLEHERNGLLINAAIEDVKEAIRTLIRDEDKRLKLGNTLKQKVFESHTWIKNAQRIIQL